MQFYILNLFYVLLLFVILKKWALKFKKSADPTLLIFFNDAGLLLILLLIGFGPVLIMNAEYVNDIVIDGITHQEQLWLSVGMALLISGAWLMYIRKIDIYEKEKLRFVVGVFVTGSMCAYFAPMGYDLLDRFHVTLNGNPINDFVYCVLAIGGLEEMVKIFPFLMLLYISDAANEPFDYILYPSAAALGFAFVENSYYINSSGLYNIGGRALYSTVAHMAFSSVIGYGMLLAKFQHKGNNQILYFVLFFGFAIFMHGFYDFWLINNYVSEFSFLTILFFLITVHVWFILKNNAVNMSTFHRPEVAIDNDHLKWYLIISLSSLLMLGYIIVTVIYGKMWGNKYLLDSWLAYGYLVLYLTLSFSRYRIAKGHISRIKIPLDFFIPKPIKKD